MFQKRSIAMLIAAAALMLIAVGLRHTRALPSGPQPIAWDSENCAVCSMLISDRQFAAQLQTTDGQTFDFDDPGCLIAFVAQKHPSIRAIYVRDYSDDRWLTAEKAGFIRVAGSPMGSGWAAVLRGTQGSVTYEQAAQEIARKHGQVR